MVLRILITILVYCGAGWLLCNIDPDTTYSWLGGIWHGLFFVPNFLRSIFTDALYKAESYNVAYNIFWWIFTVMSTISFFFSGKAAIRN